jgi:hypothetical protein
MTQLKKVTQLAWRKLLLSEAGIEGMLVLREQAPGVSVGDSHNIIFQAGKSEGYRQALETIQNLIAAEPTKPEDLENS